MAGEWSSTTLSSVCSFIAGSAFPKSAQGNIVGKYPFIKVSDMNLPGNERFITTANNWVSKETQDRLRAKLHPEGSTVFAKIGVALTYNRRRVLTQPTLIDNNMMAAIPRDGVVNPLFFYYLLCTIDFNEVVVGTALPYLNISDLSRIMVQLPSLKEQHAIAHILGALDDKIELNRRMNQTLENMAAAIFKSWFVDFDPVRAKAAGRQPSGLTPEIAALFPDSFEDSELGEIPKGWHTGVVGDVAKEAIGGHWGSDLHAKGTIPTICLRGCDMQDIRTVGFAPKAPTRFMQSSAVHKRLPSENDVLIAASGVGPCGRPLWCAKHIDKLYKHPVIYSNFVKRFTTPSPAHAVYLDRFLIHKFNDRTVHDYINGTSVPNLDASSLLSSCKLLIPPDNVLQSFFDFCQPGFQRLYAPQNVVLAALRDTLLPKLLSGGLRVPAAEAVVQEVAL